ncbi:uncharacterized protein LDX57_006157 [Aspergillus melleus]|uniref:uncharacterized protein n=1 Tax=Aspergillus melleus TaxID=138277 RepID=UPI001E8EBC59|nr:uncharacterized protein LDX57_006157 [Aspergillus melleus]KAH8428459.1 hypothetical protein LDX57_006157 [Aspergillus melleus]
MLGLHARVLIRNPSKRVLIRCHGPEPAPFSVISAHNFSCKLCSVLFRRSMSDLLLSAPDFQNFPFRIPNATISRREFLVSGYREENLRQHPAEIIDGANKNAEIDMAPKPDARIVILMLAEGHVASDVIPASGDETTHAGAFCGPDERKLVFELELVDAAIGADHGIDSLASGGQSLDIGP